MSTILKKRDMAKINQNNPKDGTRCYENASESARHLIQRFSSCNRTNRVVLSIGICCIVLLTWASLSSYHAAGQISYYQTNAPVAAPSPNDKSLLVGTGSSPDGLAHVTITSTPIEIHQPLALQISFMDASGNKITSENYAITASQVEGNGRLILQNNTAFAPNGDDIQVTSTLDNLSPVAFQIQLQGSGDPNTNPALWKGPVAIVNVEIGQQYAPQTSISKASGNSQQAVTIPYGAYDPNFNTKAPQWYLPSVVTIDINQSVTWINQDKEVHTVTSGQAAGRTGLMVNGVGKPDGLFDSGTIKPGQSWTHKFTQVGTFQYFCSLHPWMQGYVTVKQGEPIPVDADGNKITKFPLVRLVADRTMEADLGWEPHYITTGQKIIFIYQFYDNINFKPTPTYYVFKIIQNGQQLYQVEDSTQFGGGYQYFRFDKPGPVTFRFDDIAHTGQSVQYSTIVAQRNSTDQSGADEPIVEPARNIELHWWLMPLFFTPCFIAIGVIFSLKRRKLRSIPTQSFEKKTPI